MADTRSDGPLRSPGRGPSDSLCPASSTSGWTNAPAGRYEGYSGA